VRSPRSLPHRRGYQRLAPTDLRSRIWPTASAWIERLEFHAPDKVLRERGRVEVDRDAGTNTEQAPGTLLPVCCERLLSSLSPSRCSHAPISRNLRVL